MKKIILVSAGFASLSAGIAGLFLPVLPTTPFFLLAGACFLKSSRRLYSWLTGHRVFGPYIVHYLNHRAVTMRSKIVSIVMLWVVISVSLIFALHSNWVRLAVFLVGCGVTVHLVRLKTLTRQMLEGGVHEVPLRGELQDSRHPYQNPSTEQR